MIATQPSHYFAYERREVLRFLPRSYQHVLEIGAGEGRFSRHLSAAQEYWAIEPDPTAARIAAAGVPHVLCGTFESCRPQLPDGYFDLVVCNDVIEHMSDHDWFLDAIKSKMRAGGLLVGSVPNVRYVTNLFDLLVRRDWPYTDSGVLDRTHLRFFTKRSLGSALVRHGYEVEILEGINSVFRRPTNLMAVARAATALGLIIGTLGHASDVRFYQFAFRARIN